MGAKATIIFSFALLLVSASARPPEASVVADPWRLCREEIDRQEQRSSLPRGLLWAIARTESGRWNPERREYAAWPWAINAEGEGRYLPSKAAAIAAVRALLDQGLRSVDVGCMQINLRFHPEAFATLNDAFDPAANVAYAARYLESLRRETGSWLNAIGRYHSATAHFAEPYRQRVLAAWSAEASPADTLVNGIALRPVERNDGKMHQDPAHIANDGTTKQRYTIVPIDKQRTERIIHAWRARTPSEGDGASGVFSSPTVLSGRDRAPPMGHSPSGIARSGVMVRGPQAEVAFAERRADMLQQWRAALERKGQGGTPATVPPGRSPH